jgi:hypothetical protein
VRRLPKSKLVAAALLALLLALCLAVGPAGAEQSGGGGVIVSLDGSISPRYIPRHRPVPISLELAGRIAGVEGSPPPQLQRIEIAFGARGGLDASGLPVCPRGRLRNATRRQALDRCGGALVGRGEISAEVPLDPAKPLLARAGVLAFNGVRHGHPAIWVHAFSVSPPVSFVIPFYLRRLETGGFGVLMRSPVRRALGRWPRLRSFQVTFGRRYSVGGETHSYLSAKCPLPPQLSIGIVPLARATYRFRPRPTLTTTILRGCRVRR